MSFVIDSEFADRARRARPAVDEAYEPVLRWLIFTGVSAFAGVLLWRYGLIRTMVASDRTHISSVIAVLYVAASAHCLWRCVVISREAGLGVVLGRASSFSADPAWSATLPGGLVANHIRDLVAKAGAASPRRLDQTLLLRGFAQRLAAPNKLGALAADTLMKLGLLGTIVGFILMLGPIAGLDAEDEAALKTAMGAMSDGMAVAMYTTLAGLVGSILLNAQYYLLDVATKDVFWNVVRLTESKIVPTLERPHVR